MIKALRRLKPEDATIDQLKIAFKNELDEAEVYFSSDQWDELLLRSEALKKIEMESVGDQKFSYCFLGDKAYPRWLSQAADPPLALSYQGTIEHLNSKCGLSVVGSREPHEMSKNWMRQELYEYIRKNDVMIVSGGARGVDQIAHQLSIFLKKPTCVVLPTGLAHKYPREWLEAERWVNQGVLFISEMKHSSRIAKQNFAYRNRIIAALTPTTLIVEAKEKSGTLITAHHALVENRDLLFVPAHPLQSGFAGSLNLAGFGATLVRNCYDLENQIVRI